MNVDIHQVDPKWFIDKLKVFDYIYQTEANKQFYICGNIRVGELNLTVFSEHYDKKLSKKGIRYVK